VVLCVPAKPENVRLARLTAAAVGSRLGFAMDQLDDLRMAVDELCYCLMGNAGVPAELTLTFSAVPQGLDVEGTVPADTVAGPDGADGADGALPRELPMLSKRIFDALTTSYECRLDGDVRWFRLTKRVSL
jgi:hypothetical protein